MATRLRVVLVPLLDPAALAEQITQTARYAVAIGLSALTPMP